MLATNKPVQAHMLHLRACLGVPKKSLVAKTLKNIFPHLGESHLTMADNGTEFLDDATELLLKSKTPPNDGHASLIDEANSDIYTPEHQFSEVDNACVAAAASAFFSINTEVQRKQDPFKRWYSNQRTICTGK